MDEREDKIFKRSREARERSVESKESREAELDPELKAAAAMERADFLVGEVKSSKKQMQNIVVHMQEVLQTIKQLRAQLQLTAQDDDSVVSEDKARVEELKKRIADHKDELLKMKDELVAAHMQTMEQQGQATEHELQMRAKQAVEQLLGEIEKE